MNERRFFTRPARVVFNGLMIVLALAVQAAHAICVQTSQELSDALSNPDYFQTLTIELAQGTYSLSGEGGVPAGTSLLGGYTQNCLTRHIAPGNTILTSTAGQGMAFVLYGDLVLEGLTFEMPAGLVLYATGFFPSGSQILISRSVFTGGVGTATPLFVDWFLNEEDETGGLRIVNSLFVGNTSNAECAVTLEVSRGSATFDVISNTVVNNPNTTQGGICLYNGSVFATAGVLLAHDNIFYGNGGVDLYSDSPYLELVNNTIGTHDYPPPNFTPVGTLTGDPKLDANYRPIESPPSPVINSGEFDTSDLPPTDIDGGPRIVGSRVDRGAYE